MTAADRWQEENRRHLLAAIDLLHERIGGSGAADPRALERELAALEEQLEPPPALVQIADAFGLGDFERDLVLLCFAAELDPRFRLDEAPVTIAFALDVIPDAHWSAFDPAGPLRVWGLVAVDPDPPLADASLRCSDDLRSFLLGFSPDPPAGDPLAPVEPPAVVTERRAAEAEELARAILVASESAQRVAAVELHGGAGPEDRETLAVLTAAALGGRLARLDARDLPPPGEELDEALRRLNRYSRLTNCSLLVVSPAEDDAPVRDRLRRLLAMSTELLLLSVPSATTLAPDRPLIRREVRAPGAAERTEVLAACLEPVLRRLRVRRTRLLDAELGQLGWQFRFDARTTGALCLEAEAIMAGQQGKRSATALAATLRDCFRRAVRARMDPLARRVPLSGDEAVVLPAREQADLDLLAAQIALDGQVNGAWGLGHGRDASVVALFSGASGTGKTHAAAALAREVGLDLYRVDLSGVLSKYIGETEQRLGQLFDAAALGGMILLFDEADALFGKRSDVKESHDRYANITTSYLLQRIEQAPVPTILTTNLREAIDPAFLRRLHVVIDFPFPTEAAREAIWRTTFPEQTPTEGLDHERLSQLVVTGAGIDRVARRAAFLAAAEGELVEMRHLLAGARGEARYAQRDLSPAEIAGWERER